MSQLDSINGIDVSNAPRAEFRLEKSGSVSLHTYRNSLYASVYQLVCLIHSNFFSLFRFQSQISTMHFYQRDYLWCLRNRSIAVRENFQINLYLWRTSCNIVGFPCWPSPSSTSGYCLSLTDTKSTWPIKLLRGTEASKENFAHRSRWVWFRRQPGICRESSQGMEELLGSSINDSCSIRGTLTRILRRSMDGQNQVNTGIQNLISVEGNAPWFFKTS